VGRGVGLLSPRASLVVFTPPEIRLRNKGEAFIEVNDNGCGVDTANYAAIGALLLLVLVLLWLFDDNDVFVFELVPPLPNQPRNTAHPN